MLIMDIVLRFLRFCSLPFYYSRLISEACSMMVLCRMIPRGRDHDGGQGSDRGVVHHNTSFLSSHEDDHEEYLDHQLCPLLEEILNWLGPR